MENPLQTSSPRRIGFYPCCAGDIEEPRRFLAPYVDEIYFCDLSRSKAWDSTQEEPGLPKATYLQGDFQEILNNLPPIRVLFYRNDSDAEGGSGLHIVGREFLPKILARFDRTGGWIFTDGANSKGGRNFQRMTSGDWYEKPSSGFRIRKVDGFDLKNRDGDPVYALEVQPIQLSQTAQPRTRPGWVPPRDRNVPTLDTLWELCTANNRLVPMPSQWNELYGMLKNTRQKPSGGWEPPLPLILGAWHHSMPIEKQLRFKEHLEWAQEQGQLEEIGAFLRSLPETQWCHYGEI
jgi:hypothetical protein